MVYFKLIRLKVSQRQVYIGQSETLKESRLRTQEPVYCVGSADLSQYCGSGSSHSFSTSSTYGRNGPNRLPVITC